MFRPNDLDGLRRHLPTSRLLLFRPPDLLLLLRLHPRHGRTPTLPTPGRPGVTWAGRRAGEAPRVRGPVGVVAQDGPDAEVVAEDGRGHPGLGPGAGTHWTGGCRPGSRTEECMATTDPPNEERPGVKGETFHPDRFLQGATGGHVPPEVRRRPSIPRPSVGERQPGVTEETNVSTGSKTPGTTTRIRTRTRPSTRTADTTTRGRNGGNGTTGTDRTTTTSLRVGRTCGTPT